MKQMNAPVPHHERLLGIRASRSDTSRLRPIARSYDAAERDAFRGHRRAARARLRAYAPGSENRPSLVIVSAPIKRPYVWDLAPSISVIQTCMRAGFGTYLIDWREATGTARRGLAAYADALILELLEAVRAPVILLDPLSRGTVGVRRVSASGRLAFVLPGFTLKPYPSIPASTLTQVNRIICILSHRNRLRCCRGS
jgi:hypothetical protein